MKTALLATMILGSVAFANPPATTPAATGTTPAATTAAPAAKDAHAKMGHSAKAKDTATTECKNKAADGKCMDEMKK